MLTVFFRSGTANAQQYSGDLEYTDTGWFVTPRFGKSMVHGDYSQALDNGSAYRLEVGRSVDGLGYGIMAQGTLHNGSPPEEQAAAAGCVAQAACIQGDTMVLKLGGLARYIVVYQTVRVIAQAAAGVASIPLLMDEKYFQEEIVAYEWDGSRPTIHDQMQVFTNAGLIVEYPMEGMGVAPQLSLETSYITELGLGTEVLFGFNATF